MSETATALGLGSRVYVSTVSRCGEAEIAGVMRGGVLRVRWPNGDRSRVRVEHVRPIERVSPPAPKLDRAPDYTAPALMVREKSPAERSPAYLRFVRTLPCSHCGAPPPSEASHHPEPMRASVGAKTSDYRAIPLCTECHRSFHQHGVFDGYDRTQTESAAELRITRTLIRGIRERAL